MRTCSRSNGKGAEVDASVERGLCGSGPLERPHVDSNFSPKDLEIFLWNTFQICSTSLNILNGGNISSSKSTVLKLERASELPGGLVTMWTAGLTPKFLIH